MVDNPYTVKTTNRLHNRTKPDTAKYDSGKLFNLCLNLYTGFPLLDKPRKYIDSLVGENAQMLLISGDKFIHPEHCETIPVETVIDTVKHSTTGIFCQQMEPSNLKSRSKKTLCAVSLGLNKNGKNISAAILFDLSYGDPTVQKEFYYDLLGTLRDLYADLSKSRAVTDLLNNRGCYRYLINCESGELIAKRLPTASGTNNDNLAESIFRKIQLGNIPGKQKTDFDNQIKNLKIARFKLGRFEYLIFSFELPPHSKNDKEIKYNKLFRCFAHRIKNKLASLQTASSQLALQEGNIIDRDDIVLAEIIESETGLIDQLITRTRQLIELEDPELQQFDLIQTVKEIVAKNQEQFDHKVKTTIQSDSDHCFLLGDSELMKTALNEIIQNGFEAGENISIEIKDSDKITVTIKNSLTDQMYDTLANKALDITEPYISLKPNKVGLGLSIASNIISLHDGTIETRLDTNREMIIKITLPAPLSDHLAVRTPITMEKPVN